MRWQSDHPRVGNVEQLVTHLLSQSDLLPRCQQLLDEGNRALSQRV
jgi:hypothetical protein